MRNTGPPLEVEIPDFVSEKSLKRKKKEEDAKKGKTILRSLNNHALR
jgi:hypothetical protein